MTKTPADKAQRQAALDPARSFIVQAPAGSGKTELLTQRILRLLAGVRRPEEILAITFTRKAAAEMRERLLKALTAAAGPEPQADHQRTTWRLARAVLDQDRRQGWQLTDNPGRLRLQTIDSLCAGLTRQLPILSTLGGTAGVLDDARELYDLAARRTLARLEDADIGDDLAILLGHLDNRGDRAQTLLAEMLAKRDQWLRHVADTGNPRIERAALEQALADVISGHLTRLRRRFPPDLLQHGLELAGYAAEQRRRLNGDAGALAYWLGHAELAGSPPGAEPDDLPAWLGLAELWLTSSGSWRRKVDKRSGFPTRKDAGPQADAMKQAFAEVREGLSIVDGLEPLLDGCRQLPALAYADDQWRVLEALLRLLFQATAELQLVFAEQHRLDFAEVQLRALGALGTPEEPTDLALALDYRLSHILVDEFQDTSVLQYRLLELLTAGWQPDDGRSLFLVGDPMQSIYRFREAEVGLFLQVRAQGLGELKPEALNLTTNFRSRAGIVTWVNQGFAQVFPAEADSARGAVPLALAEAFHAEDETGPAVRVHPQAERDDIAEAEQVVALIRQTLDEQSQADIAVLGRGRNHLREIADQLGMAGIGFQAVDLQPLAGNPAVSDLHALVHALLRPADRIAWLSLLRAPWCGLQLADLLVIAGQAESPIWLRLIDNNVIATLSPAAKPRVERLVGILRPAIEVRRRAALRCWVEGVWIGLGGPDIWPTAADRDAVSAYLDLLERHDQAGEPPNWPQLEQALDDLYAPPDPTASPQVQLMTMHKAKGLEFDTVILPGLGRSPRQADSLLLRWGERTTGRGEPDLLIAPIRAAGQEQDPTYAWLGAQEAEKDRLEAGRLLYVAATRAKRRLHLLGHCSFDKKTGAAKAPPRSLLSELWPAVGDDFADLSAIEADEAADLAPVQPPPLRRVDAAFAPSRPPATILSTPAPTQLEIAQAELEFDWAGDTARHVGTLVHRYLERIAHQGLAHWPTQRIDSSRPALRAALAALGVPGGELADAVAKVQLALANTLADEQGRWLLAQQEQAHCEQALACQRDGAIRHYVIDRTFVADGLRWIIDYKTGSHGGGDLEEFLAHEQERYRAQLQGYAELYRGLEQREIRLGLYFPLLPHLSTWVPE